MICTIELTTFTGEQFIEALGGQLTAVGSFNAAAINSNVATIGDFSQVGIAVTLLNKWLVLCSVNTSMVQGICDTLRQGFKFFVLYQYSTVYIATQKACGCDCENDINLQNWLKEQACRFFAQIAPCLKKSFIDYTNMDCVDTIQPTYNFSAFGVMQVTDNCISTPTDN